MALGDLTPRGDRIPSDTAPPRAQGEQTQPAPPAMDASAATTGPMISRPTGPKRTVGSHSSGSYPRTTGSLPSVPSGGPISQPGNTTISRRTTMHLPRVTRLLPALDLTEAPPAMSGGAAGATEGHAEAMRRLTGAMRALSVVHDDATSATQAVRVPGAATTERRPVTVVAGRGTAVRIPASPRLTAHHPRARRALTSAVMAVASVVMVAGTLMTAHLISGRSPDTTVFTVINEQHTKTSASASSGGWYTAAGALSLGIGGGAGPGVKAPGSAGLPVKKSATPTPNPGPPPQPPQGIGVSPAPFQPWPPANPWMQVPGLSPFAMQADGYYTSSFGQCTWWAQYERRDENLAHLGNARDWASVAASRGYHVGDRPAPGATVVFQPGTQGAGGGGHVAHVIRVYPGGWFLISEMNFYWNGGGWGRVDYRYAHSGAGVLFIY